MEREDTGASHGAIAVVVTSGFASVLLGGRSLPLFARYGTPGRERETEVQVARREAAQWECVARRTRTIALDRGSPLSDLPRGPGEEPIGDLGDD